MTDRFGSVTAEFGNVTGDFGIVTDALSLLLESGFGPVKGVDAGVAYEPLLGP